MNERQVGEVRFWRDLYDRLGGQRGFIDERRRGLDGVLEWFPELVAETGWGLDLGCGPVSLFEFTELNMDATDPLLDEYNALCGYCGHIRYLKEPVGCYDFIVCKNVIDHDPSPAGVVERIQRLLVPGGRLYFEVNFDPELYAECHYKLWRMETVREYLGGFELIREAIAKDARFPTIEFYTAVYRNL